MTPAQARQEEYGAQRAAVRGRRQDLATVLGLRCGSCGGDRLLFSGKKQRRTELSQVVRRYLCQSCGGAARSVELSERDVINMRRAVRAEMRAELEGELAEQFQARVEQDLRRDLLPIIEQEIKANLVPQAQRQARAQGLAAARAAVLASLDGLA